MSSNSASMVIFQSSMQDLVKGIRNQRKDGGSSFISESIAEIKLELRSTDPYTKAEAVRKLTYLHMIGYNVSWASFAIVEVMSQAKFDHKRIGYLAANQIFNEDTDVILLVTNLFKKEFANSLNTSQYEIGLAINCLANIATKDLACDCLQDLVNLMCHAKYYIRKKAVIAMYKLYVKYPQGLRLTFEKLKDRLEDSESAVVSCAVNVICELANKNPKNYLSMAPKFFKLLTTTSNNWMLIKVVKLLGSLVCEEPRLARKLLEPLATIIQNTTAKSLQYECIHTIALALPHTKRDDGTDAKNVPAVVSLCSSHLKDLVENEDPNLKYLGLVGLLQLLASHPKVVVEMRELVLKCLSDDDITIRTKSLELLAGIVTKKTLVDLVHHLLKHVKLAEGSYRDEIIAKILYMGSKDKYALVSDYIWYVSVLQALSKVQGTSSAAALHGKILSEQLMEISLRVEAVRPYAAESMLSMLLDGDLILGQARLTVSEVLMASAWITGEYCNILTSIMLDRDMEEQSDEEDEEGDGYWIEGPCGDEIRSAWRGHPLHVMVITSLLHPRATNLPPRVQSAYIHSAMKILVQACRDCPHAQLTEIVAVLRTCLPVFLQSVYLEVQERASSFRYILAELNILAIEEESSTTSAKDIHRNKEKDSKNDLLTFAKQESSTGGLKKVILPSDGRGAAAAKEVLPLLSVLTSEPFYTVHSKAQRKVQIPEGLNLEDAFDEKSLSELLKKKMPKDITLDQVFFIPQKHNNNHQSSIYDPNGKNKSSSSYNGTGSKGLDPEEEKISKMISMTFNDSEAAGGGGDKGASKGHGIFGDKALYLEHQEQSHTKRSQQLDKSYYLPDEDENEDNDEEEREDAGGGASGTREIRRKRSKKSSKVSHSKKHSSSSSKQGNVNIQDMVPAGAAVDEGSSDDNRNGKSKSKRGVKAKVTQGSSKSRQKKNADGEEDEDLNNIDITTPLREDEVIPVQRHRETTASSMPSSTGDINPYVGDEASDDGKSKKKSKSKKKDKDRDKAEKAEKGPVTDTGGDVKKSKKPKGSAATSSVGGEMGDLLGLTWDNTITSSTAPPPEKSPSSKPAKKSSSHHHVWFPLYGDGKVDIFYAIEFSAEDNQVHLLVKSSLTPANSHFSTTIEINLSPTCSVGRLSVVNGYNHVIANGLTKQNSTESEFSIAIDATAFLSSSSNVAIGCLLKFSADSFLGSDQSSNTAVVTIPICSLQLPHQVSSRDFQSILENSKHLPFASNTLKISIKNKKSKKVLKMLMNLLNVWEVENLEKSMTWCSSSVTSSNILCYLIKVKESNETINMDIKGYVKTNENDVKNLIASVLSTIHSVTSD